MRIIIHTRLILVLFGVYALLYLIVGIQQSNFYRRISSGRAQTAALNRGDIQVGILYSDGEDTTSFLSGISIALEEINGKTNARGEKGILFELPDGKSAVSRRIRPVYLPVRYSESLTVASPLVSSLAWKNQLVAIINGLSTTMTLRTRLIPEYYGIADIAIRPTLPSLTEEDFNYFIRTTPNYRELAYHFMSATPLVIRKRTGKPIEKIGIFFSTEIPFGYLQALKEEREDANERIEVIGNIRKGFETGILNERNDISDLIHSKYLQAGLNLDSIQLERFIHRNLKPGDLENRTTLKTIVEGYNRDEAEADIVFTQSFLPSQKDFRPLIIATEEHKADLIIILSWMHDSLNLIRQIREMGVTTPIMITTITDFQQLLKIPRERLTNIYTASIYDPYSEEPRFVAFKEKLERYQRATNRKLQPPNFLSIQGYEAMHLLARVMGTCDSSVPINICNSLKYATTPWQGEIFDSFSFTPQGDIQNRKLYTIFFDKGIMTTLKDKE